MIKECPYCKKPLDMGSVLQSGRYVCPYDDCSEAFFFNKDKGSLCKMGEPTREILEDRIVIPCANPNCRKKLRIPRTTTALRVTCPKCMTSFRYPAQREEEHQEVSGLLAEFDKALEDEIKAVKTRGGDKILVALKDGKLVGEIAGGRIYQFNLERKIPVADETPAQIEIMGRNYRASIVRFLEFKLEVHIADFDGEQIPSAHLKIDATYVLRKLKEALSFLTSGSPRVSFPLMTFNRIPPKCSLEKPVFALIDKKGEGPDFFQAKAIETCLGSEVCFIHGPPGTGKTRTLVNVVNDLANNGKKILVSCHTNIACDNVIEHFIRYAHEKTVENLLSNGEIVRIGTPVLQDKRIKALTIEAIHERLERELQEKKQRLTDLTNSLVEKYRRYDKYRLILFQCEKLEERIANCKENISASKNAINEYLLEEDKFDQLIHENKKLLSIAEKRHPIINFIRGTRPKYIRLAIATWNHEKMEKTRSRQKEEQRQRLLSYELEKLTSSFLEKSRSLPEGIKIEQIESVLRETEKTLGETKLKIAYIDNRISRLNEGVVNNAKIIVSTLAKTFTDPIIMNMQFNTVAIDEASIAPLPMLFYVCSLANEKVLIFGDPKQLAPIKLATTIAAQRWLKNDIFQEAEATEDSPDDPRITSLDNHYRMHEQIFEIVNNKFYEGKMHDRKPQTVREYNRYDNLIPKPKQRVVVIDTSNANACMSTEKRGPKSRSRYNLYHIQILEKVLHDLINGNYVKQKEIGIITPYRSQASFARETLMNSGFKDIDLGTVHTFQGIEKKYVIFDLVEALGGTKIGVLVNDEHEVYSGKNRNENEALRLLTVAFSRPREKLIIIAHVKHMLDKLPKGSVIRSIIVDLIDREAIVDGSWLVPYYVPAPELPDAALFEEEELLEKEAVFNQRSFYPHLIQDLENAKKEVIFICGYIYASRVEKLMPYLSNLLSRGVTVRIFTKPPWEQKSREQELEELHHRLRDAGIEIYKHYGTHEKVVAIDRHILYEGSLNVLSFSHGSNEMMIRSDSKPKLEKVFCVLANNHPRLRDYLIKTGYVAPEQPLDLTPERFQNILDAVRPKRREIPRNKQEAKEYYKSMFTKLRWIIADDKRIPNFAVLFRGTIKAVLNDPPKSVEQLLSLPEFIRNRTNINGYEKIVLEILKEYRKVIDNGNRDPKTSI